MEDQDNPVQIQDNQVQNRIETNRAPVQPDDLIKGELYYRIDNVTGQRTIDAKFIELVKNELATYAKFDAGHNATFSDNVLCFTFFKAA